MLQRLRKAKAPEPTDLQHLTAARHDVISERMLSLSPRWVLHHSRPQLDFQLQLN